MLNSVGDEAVIATNDDAAICKHQAVKKGYYKDNYLEMFLPSKVKNSSLRKAPEINRGYYARSSSVAYLVEQFINSNSPSQIISLGAGYDSIYWRLKSLEFTHNSKDDHELKCKFVEIDMNTVTVHKLVAIKRQPKLAEILTNVTYKGEGLHSDNYHLISFDLRQVEKGSFGQKLFEDCKLDPSLPTLCLSECVLVYMPTQDSASIIRWLSSNFENLSMLNYEQCNMGDRFGDIMLENMLARHCDLMGVDACQSIDSQVERFTSQGLDYTKAWTLLEIYNQFLSPAEIDRIEHIELLDEKELLEQLLQHYCIVLASNKPIDWLAEDNYWLPKSL